MKAIVINEFGGPEVLHQREVATPKIGPGEVLIRLLAASVTATHKISVATAARCIDCMTTAESRQTIPMSSKLVQKTLFTPGGTAIPRAWQRIPSADRFGSTNTVRVAATR